jgi:hypothetical protein
MTVNPAPPLSSFARAGAVEISEDSEGKADEGMAGARAIHHRQSLNLLSPDVAHAHALPLPLLSPRAFGWLGLGDRMGFSLAGRGDRCCGFAYLL